MGQMLGLLLIALGLACVFAWVQRKNPSRGAAMRRRWDSDPRHAPSIETHIGPEQPVVSVEPTTDVSSAAPSWDRAIQTARSEELARGELMPSQRTKPNAADCWVPNGNSCRVAGREIPGGMIYVGTGLRSASGDGVEPALIDPKLPVAPGSGAVDGAGMEYWPSYCRISPSHRAAYLQWLSEGRRMPGAYVGYVFLFIYGLERRLLKPGAVLEPQEYEEIATELEELLDLYGSSSSFRGYVGNLYELVVLPHVPSRASLGSPPTSPTRGDVPLSVRIAVGHAMEKGEPIPAEWAYAWLTSHPLTRLGTAGNRCRSDFRRLFLARYANRFGTGLVVRGRAPTARGRYKPASPGFGWEPIPVSTKGTPIRRLPEEVPAALVQLAEGCVTDLEPYSRWLGKNPGSERSVAALALLPPELFHASEPNSAIELGSRLAERLGADGMALTKGSDLLSSWPVGPDGKLGKSDFVGIGQLLERLSLAVEPDVRFLGPRFGPEDSIVVFRLPESPGPGATATYGSALLVVQLTAAVAKADGQVTEDEEAHLLQSLESAFRLLPCERARLHARLRWQAVTGARSTIKNDAMNTLEAETRRALGSYLVGVAAADGTITRDEIRALERLFRRLDLEPGSVAAEMHELTLGDGSADRPVTVLSKSKSGQDFAISRPTATGTEGRAIRLDARLVDQKLQQTREVSDLLATIFAEQGPRVEAIVPLPNVAVSGLDAAHSGLLRSLESAAEWPRAVFDALAAERGLLPSGAIDVLNEAALDRTGRPVLEDDDPLVLAQEILKEMLQ